jgi:zinc transporter
MSEGEGLICAYALDGAGGGREVGWSDVEAWREGDGTLWVHGERGGEWVDRWLRERSGLPAVAAEALLAEETRPRCTTLQGGLLVILRGVNLNPGADLEDMIALRLWFEPKRIISMRYRRVMAIQDLRESLAEGCGPANAGDFLTQTAERLIGRMGPVLSDIDDRVDEIEDLVLEAEAANLRLKLVEVRRIAIILRRYLAPQREVVSRLHLEPIPWLGDAQRVRLREVTDRITRYVEDLDAVRERAALMQEELVSRLSEQLNRRMYVLSIVTAIFLPLGLLTGLLGINVGGIPFSDNPLGFFLVVALLVLIAVLQIWLFRRRHLL